ncbi:YihY/virulence factor BrkB family protein [Sulfitobacter sp. HNIBRBA3233]|uniref:YihY/virulence factor BrkB family protein n=1 Tax=Sulfitobacter marinivivus TaxID=3158558 RepID=UPI0032DEF403
MAAKTQQSSLSLFWTALKGGFSQIGETNLALLSAGVGFFAMLSLFPALAAMIALMSLIADPAVVMTQLEEMRTFLPSDVYDIFQAQIVSLVTTSPDTLGVASAISILVALWSARAGVAAMMTGLNAVHGEKNRTTTSHYIRAILLTLALMGVAIVSLLTLVVAPVILAFFPLGWLGTLLVELLRWSIAIVVLLIGVLLLYRYGPNRDRGMRRSTRPGAVTAVVSWAFVSIGFSYYVANFGNYNQVYGSIGAVIAMLVWMWISSFLVLLGAVVNAQVEKVVYGVNLADPVSPFEEVAPTPEEIADETPGTALP